MEYYQLVKLCPSCIDDVLDGEIEFTEPTIINEVKGCKDCDNAVVEDYNQLVTNRGKILMED